MSVQLQEDIPRSSNGGYVEEGDRADIPVDCLTECVCAHECACMCVYIYMYVYICVCVCGVDCVDPVHIIHLVCCWPRPRSHGLARIGHV